MGCVESKAKDSNVDVVVSPRAAKRSPEIPRSGTATNRRREGTSSSGKRAGSRSTSKQARGPAHETKPRLDQHTLQLVATASATAEAQAAAPLQATVAGPAGKAAAAAADTAVAAAIAGEDDDDILSVACSQLSAFQPCQPSRASSPGIGPRPTYGYASKCTCSSNAFFWIFVLWSDHRGSLLACRKADHEVELGSLHVEGA
jgi:hypothetical protein